MSLATRCTACSTVFRVVQDQLKISEGWVRCGRCGEVFNALDSLFDLDREGAAATRESRAGAPAAPPPARPATQDAHRQDAHGAAEEARASTGASPARAPAPASTGTTLPSSTAESATASVGAPADAGPPSPARLPSRPILDSADSEPSADFADARFPSELDDGEARAEVPAAEAPEEPAPHFLRAAERAARWQRPGVRAALAMLALLLGLALALQVAWHTRDELAARWPASRSLLQALCDVAGCRIEAPRRVEQLVVDSSGLVKLEGAGLYRLEVVLRNRGPAQVRVPAIDLSLLDLQGRLVSRKVLMPAELGVAQPALPPDADVALQAVLAAGELGIGGYTIEIFYP